MHECSVGLAFDSKGVTAIGGVCADTGVDMASMWLRGKFDLWLHLALEFALDLALDLGLGLSLGWSVS